MSWWWPFSKKSAPDVLANNGAIGVGGGVHNSTLHITQAAQPSDGTVIEHLKDKSPEELRRIFAAVYALRGDSPQSAAEAVSRIGEAAQALPEAAQEIGKPQKAAPAEQALLAGDPRQAIGIYRELADQKEREGRAAYAEAAQALRYLAAFAYLNNKAEAFACLARAAQLAPDDFYVQRDLGDIASDAGDILAAITAQEAALGIAERQQDERNIAMMHDRLCIMHQRKGDLTQAEWHAQASLNIFLRRAERDPANTACQRDLSVSHNKIGDIRATQGDLAGALKSFDAGLVIRQSLTARDPANTEWQRDLSVSHNRIGDVRRAQGDLAGALKSFEASLAIAQTLAARDPANARWQGDLAASYGKIGQCLRSQGRVSEAKAAFERGLAIVEPLVKRSPDVVLWQQYREIFLAELASLTDKAP